MSLSIQRVFKFAIFAAAAIAAVNTTALSVRRPTEAETVIYVGDKAVRITTSVSANAKAAAVDSPAVIDTLLVNSCGVKCVASCNSDAGTLPPILDDCEVIKDAITIYQGQVNPAFIVQPFTTETLTYGTCSYFVENTSEFLLEACWTDLKIKGSSAGSSCFPPVLPINSEGLCSSADGVWAIGVGHSSS